MKIQTIFFLFLFAAYPFIVLGQGVQQKDNVTISGKIVDYKDHKNGQTINLTFRDFLSQNLLKEYVAEVDSSGEFFIRIPIKHTQDFYLQKDGIQVQLLCSTGDSIFLKINSMEKKVEVVGGNRAKDNDDFIHFLNRLNNVNNQTDAEAAKTKSSGEFTRHLINKEINSRAIFDKYREKHKTSVFFNHFIDDYLKYSTLYALLSYPLWNARQNNIRKDSVKLTGNYYEFLDHYNMNDSSTLSTNHVEFLYQFYNYVNQNPKDSMDEANDYFKNGNIVKGGKVLRNMILKATTGFTRNVFLTRFYLDALNGNQLKAFEGIYDSTEISNRNFSNLIDERYHQLQKFMANQNVVNANLKSIKSKVTKSLLDTISARYAGKVIYIDFWAPWCIPCMEEMPYSKSLQEKYKDKDVIFLFLANQCEEDSWRATIANRRLTGEHILLTNDQYNVLAGEFDISGIPHYVLVDKKGNIISENAPRPSQKIQVELEFDKLLNQDTNN